MAYINTIDARVAKEVLGIEGPVEVENECSECLSTVAWRTAFGGFRCATCWSPSQHIRDAIAVLGEFDSWGLRLLPWPEKYVVTIDGPWGVVGVADENMCHAVCEAAIQAARKKREQENSSCSTTDTSAPK